MPAGAPEPQHELKAKWGPPSSGERPRGQRPAPGLSGRFQKGVKKTEVGRQGAEHGPALFTEDVVGLMAKPRTCTHSLQVLMPVTGPQGSREEARLFWEPQTAQRRRLLSADGTE